MIDGEKGAGVTMQAGVRDVDLRAELNRGHISDTDNPTVRRLAHDDILELLRGRQQSARHRHISELLAVGHWFASGETDRIYRVLLLNGVSYVRDRHVHSS